MLVLHAIFLCSSGISSTSLYRSKCKQASFSCISLTCSICSMEQAFPEEEEEEPFIPPPQVLEFISRHLWSPNYQTPAVSLSGSH